MAVGTRGSDKCKTIHSSSVLSALDMNILRRYVRAKRDV